MFVFLLLTVVVVALASPAVVKIGFVSSMEKLLYVIESITRNLIMRHYLQLTVAHSMYERSSRTERSQYIRMWYPYIIQITMSVCKPLRCSNNNLKMSTTLKCRRLTKSSRKNFKLCLKSGVVLEQFGNWLRDRSPPHYFKF